MTGAGERRRFNDGERVALYLAAGGRCECQGCRACGPGPCTRELDPGWHADHVHPHSRDGKTDVTNGQAMCPPCNREKGDKMDGSWHGAPLRDWQREALDVYLRKGADDFLAVATPGAGKTTFALRVAHEMLSTGIVERVVVVVPSDHLKVQWAQAAHRCGIAIDPTTKNRDGLENRADYTGAALTYSQVAKQPALHRTGAGRRRTLVILDEIHHSGDEKAWGDGIKYALEPAARRLALSGTPFRSDTNPIPFVTYEPGGDKVLRSVADYSYGYGRAIRDDVCRQVDFHFYDGEMRWRDSGALDPDKVASLSTDLGENDRSAALETALDPATGWMRALLGIADNSLTEMRVDAPNAGGLVIAYRADLARAYAKDLKAITGEEPVVVLSEDGPEASSRISAFDKSNARWLVAVKMVSEGVDVPRLAVGVYATRTGTPMFFRQAVGRFVRRRAGEEHSAILFCPALAALRTMAAQIETEIRDEIEEERKEYEQSKPGTGGGVQGTLDLFERTPVAASPPVFDRAIHSGQEYTPAENLKAEEMCRKYGFGLGSLAQMRRLVRTELSRQAAPAAAADDAKPSSDVPAYQYRKTLAADLNRRIRRHSVRNKLEFKGVNWTVNQHMGVTERSQATIDQLKEGIELVVRWERAS
jgi:superfamily II DNA or RNA helicase